MSNEQGYLDNSKLVYGVDDNPSISKKIIFGIQHIFAAFGGIIVVPLVIAMCSWIRCKNYNCINKCNYISFWISNNNTS